MPRKVPRRWADKDQSRWSVCMVKSSQSGAWCASFDPDAPARSPTHVRRPTFQATTNQLPGAVSLPVAGPLAAWMPPRSLHGRIHGVSCKW
ncbi:hypothetical protein XarbCFBP8153_00140 [Xanthomonas arboricola]|nr:hypothetical protein XarbCFBP8153_00140 [Xanthomonas arboricola]